MSILYPKIVYGFNEGNAEFILKNEYITHYILPNKENIYGIECAMNIDTGAISISKKTIKIINMIYKNVLEYKKINHSYIVINCIVGFHLCLENTNNDLYYKEYTIENDILDNDTESNTDTDIESNTDTDIKSDIESDTESVSESSSDSYKSKEDSIVDSDSEKDLISEDSVDDSISDIVSDSDNEIEKDIDILSNNIYNDAFNQIIKKYSSYASRSPSPSPSPSPTDNDIEDE